MESAIDESSVAELDDWNLMSLRHNLNEEHDFVIVNKATWTQLRAWFKGGPTIHLFMANGGFSDKEPDLEPITVTLSRRDPKTEREIKSGMLVSLKATDVQLLNYVGEFLHNEAISLKFKEAQDKDSAQILKFNKPLKDYGIRDGSLIFVSEKTEQVYAGVHTLLVEEEKNPTLVLTEEEMLRMAIEESLKDVVHPALEDNEELKRNKRRRLPELQIEIEPSNPSIHPPAQSEENKVEKPKTPSTGESTPTWRIKKQLELQKQQEQPRQNTHYQHLLQAIES